MRKHGALQAGAVRHQQAASLQALNGRGVPAIQQSINQVFESVNYKRSSKRGQTIEEVHCAMYATTPTQQTGHEPGHLYSISMRHQQAARLQALNGRAVPATTRKQQGGR
jgi:hypothetical protein